PGLDRLADAAALLDRQNRRLFPRAVELDQPLVLDQVNGLPGLAAEADEDVRGDVGVFGEAGEGAVELVVVGAVVLHGTASLVRDGDNAVHVRVLAKQVRCPDALGDVFAGAGRAVDGADDGNVIPRAEAAVAAVVADEPARIPGGHRRRRAVAAES